MAKPDPPSPWRLFHLGLEFSGAALILGLVGWWIDGRYGTAPWGALIGGAIGFVGGMYLLIKEALKANRPAAGTPTRPREPDPDKDAHRP